MRRILWMVMAAGALGCTGAERHASSVERQAPDSQRTALRAQRSMTIDSLMSQVLPAAAVTIGVEATPERADSILAENGFTLDRFEATLYTIAADSAASQLFEAALGR
ncbi:MAG TPA: hypothetical protein VFK36_07540 [Gemmatimonadales bacterium]|nr:hypothetical protein [Gemmatimonadales bacterium]